MNPGWYVYSCRINCSLPCSEHVSPKYPGAQLHVLLATQTPVPLAHGGLQSTACVRHRALYDMHAGCCCVYKQTSIENLLLRCAIKGVSAKALWRQYFIVMSAMLITRVGQLSKVMPIATMWQCFRINNCKAYTMHMHNIHIYYDWTCQACPHCTWTCRCMFVGRRQMHNYIYIYSTHTIEEMLMIGMHAVS